MKLSEKLMQEAVACIDKIMDPVAKINSIAQIMPFVGDIEVNTVASDIPTPKKESKKAKETAKEEVKQAVEEAVKETKAEETNTPEQLQDMILEKYGDMSFEQAFKDNADVKLAFADYTKDNIKERLFRAYRIRYPEYEKQLEQIFIYYFNRSLGGASVASQATLRDYIEKFAAFSLGVVEILGYSRNDIIDATDKCLPETKDTKKRGIGAVTPDNYNVILQMLKQPKKQVA